MKLRNYIIIFLFLLFAQDISAQIKPGRLSGKVIDKSTREDLLDAIVRIELNGRLCGGARADYEGNYSIENLQPGRYKVIASYIGKRTEFNDVLIESDSTRILNIEIEFDPNAEVELIVCYWYFPQKKSFRFWSRRKAKE